MKFTLDTDNLTIELLSAVIIKELIALRNTIVGFDNYTVKGKITEVQKELDKSKGLKPYTKIGEQVKDIYDDIIKKSKEEERKNPPIWKNENPMNPWPKVMYHIDPNKGKIFDRKLADELYKFSVALCETPETEM